MDRNGMDHEVLKAKEAAEVRAKARGGEGSSPAMSAIDQARYQQNYCATESLKSRAWGKAQSAASDAARHERLAGLLTPEIELTLFVLQECIALGLIDVGFIADALARPQTLRRDRF